jgi:adenosylmethionine-8-amino-7-oxononanoate aminotransferase
VTDVRVKGAIGVVELNGESEGLRHAFPPRGAWIRPFGRIVYLTPPLVVGPDDLARLIDALVAVVADWSQGRA